METKEVTLTGKFFKGCLYVEYIGDIHPDLPKNIVLPVEESKATGNWPDQSFDIKIYGHWYMHKSGDGVFVARVPPENEKYAQFAGHNQRIWIISPIGNPFEFACIPDSVDGNYVVPPDGWQKQIGISLLNYLIDNHMQESVSNTREFWDKYVKSKDDPLNVRADANHYVIGPKLHASTPSHCLGFSGAKVSIHFNDGRVVETNNLWHQGRIPDEYAVGPLTDNARLVWK